MMANTCSKRRERGERQVKTRVGKVEGTQARTGPPEIVLADTVPRLTIRELRQLGAVKKDLPTWTTFYLAHPTLGTMRIDAEPRSLSIRTADMAQHIPVAWERVEVKSRWFDEIRIAGVRPWLVCRCGGRVMKLLLVEGELVCRKCSGLRYASEVSTPKERKRLRALAIRRLFGVSSLTAPFPKKPWRMRWERYWRLRLEEAVCNPASLRDRRWLEEYRAWRDQGEASPQRV